MLKKITKRARPIPDKKIYHFVNKNIRSNFLYKKDIHIKFLKRYFKWIQKSSLNKLIGIKKFKELSFVHGTSQAFDEFYRTYSNKRFRCFKGEFKYHEIIWKENKIKWKYLNNEKIRKNDAVIISVPFSDYGSIHPDTEKILLQCDKLDVPVLIDLAYYSIAKSIKFNVDRKCIKVLAFSLSKSFFGTERVRIGMRCKRKVNYDPPELFTEMGMLSRISAGLGLKLLSNYSTDYCQNSYRNKQLKICKKLNLIPSDCVIFGLGKNGQYKSFNRGSKWSRVCISNLLGNMKDLNG